MDPEGDAIRRLVQQAVSEVGGMPSRPYPGMLGVAVNHPGVLTHQLRSDDEWQQQVRYVELMKRLKKIQEEHSEPFRDTVLYNMPDVNRLSGDVYMRPVRGRDLPAAPQEPSPYRKRGMLDEGMPLSNAFQVIQAPFSLAANTARSAYNLDRAAEEAPYVANKATGGLWNAAQGKDPNEAWARERKFSGSVPFNDPRMLETGGNPSVWHAPQRDRGLIEGPDYLKEDFGAPDHWGTDLAGYGLEAVLDPVTGATQAAKHVGKAFRAASPYAKGAHALRASSLFGQELALPGVFVGLGEYNRQSR
jgi:hypothetical protein